MEDLSEHLLHNTVESEGGNAEVDVAQDVYQHVSAELVTQLFELVKANNLDAIQQALQNVTKNQILWLFRAYNEEGLGLLHLAIKKANLNIVEYFLGLGAEMNRQTGLNYKPKSDAITIAAQLGNAQVIDLLLAYQEYPINLTAHLAVAIRGYDVYADCLMKFLVNKDVEDDFKDAIVQKIENEEEVYAPLDEAVRKKNVELVRSLLAIPKIKAAINEKGKNGATALHWAAFLGHQEIFALLWENGAEPFVVGDHADETILHYAVLGKDDNKQFVEFLLQNPEIKGLLDTPDAAQRTPLHYASIKAAPGLVAALTERDVHFTLDEEGQSALHYACKNADLASVNTLLAKFPNAQMVFSAQYNTTPYWNAVLAERNDDPSPDIVAVQERLLAFIHNSKSVLDLNEFIDNLFTATLDRIVKIPDDNLRQKMCAMYDVLKKDYVREIIPLDPVKRAHIIAQNNKILCLTQLLGSTADRYLADKESKQEIANDFKKYSDAKLYSERTKRLALQIIGGIIGGLLFGVVGFFAGAAITAGPGAPVLAGVGAIEGAAIGAAAACAVGAAVVGGASGVGIGSLFVRTLKWQYSLWQVHQACKKHSRAEVVVARRDDGELLLSEGHSAEMR